MDMTALGTNIKNAIIAKLNALLPSQGGNSGKVLGTNGSSLSWVANGGGTVFYNQSGLAIDGNNGNFFIITTSGSSTITLSNIAIGVPYNFMIKNTHPTAVIAITLPSTADVKAVPVFEISVGKYKEIAMIFNGTTRYWAMPSEELSL